MTKHAKQPAPSAQDLEQKIGALEQATQRAMQAPVVVVSIIYDGRTGALSATSPPALNLRDAIWMARAWADGAQEQLARADERARIEAEVKAKVKDGG